MTLKGSSFSTLCRFIIADDRFDAETFVRACPLNMTGADFYALASDAYLRAIRRLIGNREEPSADQVVRLIKEDFDSALVDFTPSLDINEIHQYERLQKS